MCAYARVRARSWLCKDFVVLPLLLAFEPVSVPPTLCPSVLRGCNFVCVCAHGCKGRANRTCQRQKSAQPQCPPPRSVPAVDTTIASRRPNQEPRSPFTQPNGVARLRARSQHPAQQDPSSQRTHTPPNIAPWRHRSPPRAARMAALTPELARAQPSRGSGVLTNVCRDPQGQPPTPNPARPRSAAHPAAPARLSPGRRRRRRRRVRLSGPPQGPRGGSRASRYWHRHVGYGRREAHGAGLRPFGTDVRPEADWVGQAEGEREVSVRRVTGTGFGVYTVKERGTSDSDACKRRSRL